MRPSRTRQMLAVLFLGVAASYELSEGVNIFDYGLAIALVITASGVAVYLFARVHHARHALEEQLDEPAEEVDEHRLPAE